MGLKRTLIYIAVALVAWKAGSPVFRYLFSLLSSGLAAIFGSSGGAAGDPTSLRAAIRNVTTDYDQLTSLVQEFFRQSSQLREDDTSETLFRDFLEQRATKSRPTLEQALDWILALYKVIWPVLVVFLVSKLNTSRSRPEEGDLPLEASGSLASQLSTDARHLPNGDASPGNGSRHDRLRQHRSQPAKAADSSSVARPKQLPSSRSGIS